MPGTEEEINRGSAPEFEEKVKEEVQKAFAIPAITLGEKVIGVDLAAGDDSSAIAIRDVTTGEVKTYGDEVLNRFAAAHPELFTKHRSAGITNTTVGKKFMEFVQAKEEKKSTFDLNECKFETFTVEGICRVAKEIRRDGKVTTILVISPNKKESQRRAKMLYAVLARAIKEPYFGKIVMKNGAIIRFIEDYDQLGTFEPEHVYE